MKYIKLTQGYKCKVDDEDWELLKNYNWHVTIPKSSTKYAKRRIGHRNIFMHRIITNCPINMVVDHIDGNGLNNQRSNLRIVSRAQNCQNSNHQKRNTTRYKGVVKRPGGKYEVNIFKSKKAYYLGRYDCKHEAALIYKNKAIELFKEYAKLNIIKKGKK